MWTVYKLQKQMEWLGVTLCVPPEYHAKAPGALALQADVHREGGSALEALDRIVAELEREDRLGLLDVWMFHEACRLQERRGGEQCCEPLVVKMSAQTLCNPYYIYDIALCLRGCGIPPSAVQISVVFDGNTLCVPPFSKGVAFLQKLGVEIRFHGPDGEWAEAQ